MHGQLSVRMRCLRPGGRRRCPVLGGDTAAFCASLIEGLAHLESTLEVDHGGGGVLSSGSVSMRWCVDAMLLVKRMQREMLAIFRKADVPAAGAVSSRGGGAAAGAGDWFEHYMQETAALLDFCNAFKAAVSRMHRYCMVVDFAAQVGGGAGAAAASLVVESAAAAPRAVEAGGQRASSAAAAARDKIAEVKATVAEAERLGRTIISGGSGGDGGGMVVVTLVAKITTSVLAMFVLQALASPPAQLGDGAGVRPTLAAAVDVPELEPWCESLSLIHARFPSRATVAEHEKVAMVVRDLVNGGTDGGGHGCQQEEAARGHVVELLRARSGELREGVEMFACVLDEVFDEVIRGRNEMLGILRDKALT
ncbi:uncharacterized protein LOC120643883 [Panicum virgatum]|uniref:Uncharacterized protein n=1 Tax=Panicum virgatum TaxID=38727 RepID=A0A8T0PIX3_PANVG|nr:uncharacterized protein LOC120643883 [Panicum virgatum]KAG2560858.1 hypothetical protein PVAP13_8KG092430 [Panicum virgatum]